jgi:cardiolipin synthase
MSPAFAQNNNPFEYTIVPDPTPIGRAAENAPYRVPISIAADPIGLAGRWELRGKDDQGAFAGSMEFTATPDERTFNYERRINGVTGLEAGTAQIYRDHILLHEDPRTASGLATLGAIGNPNFGAMPLRSGMFRMRIGGHGAEGRTWIAGNERSRSEETLRRSGQDLANNDVELLIDGPEAFPVIYDAIENAKSSILLQTFSWFDDDSGKYMADLLARKAKEGVTVRCLLESFPQFGGMMWRDGDDDGKMKRWTIDERLEGTGVDLIIQNKMIRGLGISFKRGLKKLFRMRVPREERGFLTHDHRKLIVVDGNVAFTGGMNVGNKYEAGTTWHDVHSRVRGSAVPVLEKLFYDRWHNAGGKGDALPAESSDPWPGDLEVIVEENLPGVRLDVTDRYLDEIHNARKQVLIENPYFLYDPVVNALKQKAREGVETVVIIPANDLNDEGLARDAFFFIQNDVIRAGVKLYKYRDRMCHGKVAVFDGARTTLGTTNLDQMAMERNAEVNLYVPDRGFAKETVSRVFDPDIDGSDRIEVKKHSWWTRVKGFLMHSIRRFL